MIILSLLVLIFVEYMIPYRATVDIAVNRRYIHCCVMELRAEGWKNVNIKYLVMQIVSGAKDSFLCVTCTLIRNI